MAAARRGCVPFKGHGAEGCCVWGRRAWEASSSSGFCRLDEDDDEVVNWGLVRQGPITASDSGRVGGGVRLWNTRSFVKGIET